MIRIHNFEGMTGAIVSQFYWKNEFGKYSRYFTHGSFFFIKPDLAITAYSNLAASRSKNDMIYAEDYLYFDSGLHRFDSALKLKDRIQCIRIEREMLKEFPDKNITEIHFDFQVSQNFFKVSDQKINCGSMVLCEGYNSADPLELIEDPETIDFLWLSK